MTDISRKKVRCAKCGNESQQLIIYSVNYSLGDKESNDKLISHKQKCLHCGYENYRIDLLNNNLQREEIIKITDKFVDDSNKYEIFKIPNELYLDYFKKIEEKLHIYNFEEDDRFVTYGRLSFLKEELTQRLNDNKLQYEEPNSAWGKSKWDNRMGAFIDLLDYIKGDRYIAPHQIPEGKNFNDILLANDQYYKDGIICKQERDILLEMIKEIKSFIENNSEISKFVSVNKTIDEEMEENDMGLFSKKNKYDIDEKDNRPQIVYGIPDSMRKKWQEEEEKIDSNCIFEAFEGGYFGPSYYYYINEYNNKYYFRFGFSQDGRSISNSRSDSNLHEIQQDNNHYEKMISEINDIVKDWKESYYNNQIMDGTQWNLEIIKANKKYSGSNEFPENYSKLKNVLYKYFNVSSFTKNEGKYDINPEDNMPREVYGIPSPKENGLNKYDINPEKNIPQKLYGIPDFMIENKNKCPYCESTELWEYLYGKIADGYDVDKYILGGCEITANQPTHKCKKCNKDIYPENTFTVPNNQNVSKADSIRISIKNEKSNYVLLLNHYLNSESYNLSFANLENLENKSISDISTSISKQYYKTFNSRLIDIIKTWNDSYMGDNRVSWNIKIDTDLKRVISGNGGFPSNWNSLIDLMMEYENIFKQKKEMDIEKIKNMKYDNLSFEDGVKDRFNDPFWAEIVIKYFKEELKQKDAVSKICFKDLMKYDDILNEFTKSLIQKTYDLKDAIEINGYTAKKIYELNPKFNASGVYSFMQLLRDNPDKAKKIIDSGFATKDAIPPVINENNGE